MLSFKDIVKEKVENMIENKKTDEEIETMKYLYNLINNDFEGENINNSTYTAPNGKKYSIESNSKGYTSSNFITSGKYFTTLSEMKKYIDGNNPASEYKNISIDQSRYTSEYKAPNGKIYVFFKTTDGKYGSNNFISGKLFTDLAVMKKHIDVNNR